LENNTSFFNRKTLVRAEFGIHAKPASRIAQMAESACSAIWLVKGALRVDAADVLDILSLSAVKGTEIIVEIENQEDMEILNRIVDFFETGFGERI
jgi:phosphocarrier protein HPr